MREGLLPGSSYWVPAQEVISKQSAADDTESRVQENSGG